VDAAVPVIDKMLNEFKRPGKKDGARLLRVSGRRQEDHLAGTVQCLCQSGQGTPTAAEFAELQERLLYRQSIEAARCYEEGVLRSVADANIGSIFGIGMAPWTGGQLQYINFIGVKEFVRRADELAAKHGERFTPPKLLRGHGRKGRNLRLMEKKGRQSFI
jgi:3-hydroxyacyl-CoA dehydrogenase/enoyl-CoA hydratase/3-hydroxybutyryl-CoA epimerase